MKTPRPRERRPTRGERGSVLAGVLAITAALMGAAALAAFSGYTNLLVTSNLRGAARAKASAEASINEAIHRLALPDTTPGAIVPALTDPDWNVGIHFTTGDTNPSDHTLSTIQAAAHWPVGASPATPAVTLQFKRDEDGNVVYYNRLVPPADPPFLTVALPSPIGPIVGSVYDVLCQMPSILGIQVGGLLGLCPVGLPSVGYPVIELRATGVDARGARRELLVEVVRSIAYTPLAPLNVGGNVNFNNTGFFDGVNHDHRIYLTGGAAAASVYGDAASETTADMALLGLLPTSVIDSPDDHDIWVPPVLPLTETLWLAALKHNIANVSLVLFFQLNPPYTSFPRLFNMQIASNDPTSAWVGVSQLEDALVGNINLGALGVISAANLGLWTGMNLGYSAPIALSPTATVANAPVPATAYNSNWTGGVFSWRVSNAGNGAVPRFHGSVNFATQVPAASTVVECGPTVTGAAPPLVCRPSSLVTFPEFKNYLGIGDGQYQSLLAAPDTTAAQMTAGQPPSASPT